MSARMTHNPNPKTLDDLMANALHFAEYCMRVPADGKKVKVKIHFFPERKKWEKKLRPYCVATPQAVQTRDGVRGVRRRGIKGAQADIPRTAQTTPMSLAVRRPSAIPVEPVLTRNPSRQGSRFAPAANSFNPSKTVKDIPVL